MTEPIATKDEKPEKTYSLPNSPYDFVEQIVDEYPTHYDKHTLRKLIGVGRITYSQSPSMTACVVDTKPYTLTFGVPFMEENMRTTEDCVYMLSHELTHLVLGHFAQDVLELFEDKKLGESALGIIIDCQVNATCYHSLREEKYFEFVKRFYSQDKMPVCFMREDGEVPDELKDTHKKLYSKEGITNEELIDALLPWFKQNQDKINEFNEKYKLGNHEDLKNGRISGESDETLTDLAEHVANQMEEWIKDPEKEKKEQGKSKGSENAPEGQGEGDADKDIAKEDLKSGEQAGKGDTVRKQTIRTCKSLIEYARRVKSQLKNCWEQSPSGRIHAAIESMSPNRVRRGVIPNFRDSNATAVWATGNWPIFYRQKRIGSKVIIPCYLDVSGSQSHVLPVVLPVVARLKEMVGNEVYCFSDYIAPATIYELEAGTYRTSHGTDFNPVADHILKNQFQSAVIITDGHASLSPDLAHKLRSRGVTIKVGWTVPNPSLTPLKQIAKEMFYIFNNPHS